MNHYTYLLTYSDGLKYIGVRSCKKPVEEDVAYNGSSLYAPKHLVVSKEILGQFLTREEAIAHEIQLHEQYDVGRSPLFYNRCKQTSIKFDTSGASIKRTLDHNSKIKGALTGRKRSPAECAAISAGKKGKKTGPCSEIRREAIRQANKGQINHMRGKRYDPVERARQYASRCKDNTRYAWFNRSTGESEVGTCQEMGIKYGRSAKPTRQFLNVVNPDCVTKSYHGWELENEQRRNERC